MGATFEVSLEGSPTTGFTWEAELPPSERELVEPVGTEWRRSDDKKKLGGSATQIFRFRALRRGETTLRFRYRRPWESGAISERLVPVHIEEAG